MTAPAETASDRPASLAMLAREARGCERCPLFRDATQTVFGEGPERAVLVLVGEQPGDQEDLAGRPFVGPAGRLLDKALAEAGIDRSRTYVTNAVKHFKFEQRGKRRLHKRPNAHEIERCHWWLDGELAAIRPQVVLALGATALRALSGRPLSISAIRDRVSLLPGGARLMATVHPSYLLRMRDAGGRRQAYAGFVDDLRRVAAEAPALQA